MSDEERDILDPLGALLDREEAHIAEAMAASFGTFPKWVPLPTIEHAERLIKQLENDGFSAQHVADFITAELNDSLVVPGIVLDSVAFIHVVNELAHIKYAVTLGPEKGLEMLAGEFASIGKKFRQGRKVNSGGTIRKAIARELKKQPNLKPREIWKILASKPPKGWDFFDNSAGKYIEGPKGGEGMAYARFSEVCKEEKNKLRT